MGFFDKLKASVGIGNTSVTLDAPYAVTGEQKFVAKVTLRGGAHQQKLTKLDAQLVIKNDTSSSAPNTPPETRLDLARAQGVRRHRAWLDADVRAPAPSPADARAVRQRAGPRVDAAR